MASAHDPLSIPLEEERLLSRVQQRLLSRPTVRPVQSGPVERYNEELISLRDQIAESRLEDVPALIAHMERIQSLAAVQADKQGGVLDLRSPYFGHLRLEEWADGANEPTTRDILIGRATYLDVKRGIRIVDWRNAPISQLYYRCPEGGTYEERFGNRDVEGEVLIRRVVRIEGGALLQIQAPQGNFLRSSEGEWRRLEPEVHLLAGGQGSATRPADVARGITGPVEAARASRPSTPRADAARGTLGVAPEGLQRLDRHLPAITGLIDPRQFELISAPESGVVVIQGGAGSGKTTIGLHRMAFLAYADPKRFQPRRMLVVTYGQALAAYIDEVLPALGVGKVDVVTVADWALRMRKKRFPWLDIPSEDEAPAAVTRLKKHPALLKELEQRVKTLRKGSSGRFDSRDVVRLWAEMLTDLPRLLEVFRFDAEDPLTDETVRTAHAWCSEKCDAVLEYISEERISQRPRAQQPRGPERGQAAAADRQERDDSALPQNSSEIPYASIDISSEGVITVSSEDPPEEEDVWSREELDLLADEKALSLDVEDDVLLVRALQLLIGPLRRKRRPLYSHIFVDEAQDLSPIELAMMVEQVAQEKSITLAGDTSQRLFLHNGFHGWEAALRSLRIPHLKVEPLRIAYRSTREIMELAYHAMGPIAPTERPGAPRSGAPVECFRFSEIGASVAFLAQALIELLEKEPRATVGLLARHPEQADLYHQGLRRARVPLLRRIEAGEFSFRPGVDVTEIRQVKGLEFDYVILVDVNASTFSTDDQSRHLFHIGATRAAFQLWLIMGSGMPSPLIPDGLLAA